MDEDSYYNHILIHEKKINKIGFMTEHTNYRSNVMPFGLKNMGAIYKWIMNNYF